MPDVSSVQDNFLSGEWSPFAQGRITHPKYKTAMNVCRNSLPVESGAWTRRSGDEFIATTRNGADGRLIEFDFEEPNPYRIELTNNHLRLSTGTSLVFTDDPVMLLSVTNNNPAQFVVSPSNFVSGDQVQFLFNGTLPANAAILRRRQFILTEIGSDGTTYTLTNPISGAAISNVGWAPDSGTIQMVRILDLTSPFTSTNWSQDKTRLVQPGVNPDGTVTGQTLMLRGDVAPQVLLATADETAPQFATFSLTPAILQDGPYLDPVPGLYATPSGLGPGTINVTVGYQAYNGSIAYFVGDIVVAALITYVSLQDANVGNTPGSSPTFWKAITGVPGINGGQGFVATDVGRHIRLFSEPPVYVSGTSYAVGKSVQYPLGSGQYWTAQTSAGGTTTPGSDFNVWAIGNSVAQWAWGRISAILSTLEVSVQLIGFDPAVVTQGATNTLLYTTTIYTWRLGAFSETTFQPACGTYHGGRIYLGGAIKNRFDASVANGVNGAFINMAPTAQDGTVSDNNGISFTLNASDNNSINWMQSIASGIIMGTFGGEWLVQASALNDPITPTSIQANCVSRYKGANIEPLNTPIATLYVQKFGRTILELLPDVFTGKYRSPNVTLFSGHLLNAGVAEIRYQEALTPVVWARMNDGTLAGATYRRISSFVSGESDQAQEAAIIGWHRHDLASGRSVQSIMVGQNASSTLDALAMVTNQTDPDAVDFNVRHISVLVDLFQETDPLTSAWYLDDAVVPQIMAIGVSGVTLYGLWHLNGKTVTAWIGGLDTGDYLVSNGEIFVPWGAAGPAPAVAGLFTKAYLQGLNSNSYGNVASVLSSVTVTTPPGSKSPGTMQWFTDTVIGHGTLNNGWALPDWDNDRVTFFNSAGGLTQFQISTGTLLLYKSATDIFTNGHQLSLGDGCLGTDGNIYFCTGANTIAKINSATLTLISESIEINPGVGIVSLAGVQNADGTPYLAIGVNGGSGPGGVEVMDCTTMALIGGSLTTISDGTSVSLAASITQPFAWGIGSGSAQQSSLKVYQINVSGANTVFKIAFTISALAVDPTWMGGMHWNGVPVVDLTDGNPMFIVTNGTTNYILKTSVTGTILWKVKMPSGNIAMWQGTWNHSRVTNGVVVFQVGANIVLITTTNGSSSVTALGSGNGQIGGGQVSDSVTGRSLCFSNFAAATSSLNVQGTNGTPPGFTFDWGILKLGTFFEGPSTTVTDYSVPAVVGFPTVAQGQRLRPQLPADAGTANGPALAKNMRTQQYGFLLVNSVGLSAGPDFDNLLPIKYWEPDETPIPPTEMYQGVMWVDGADTVWDFDNMLAWQISRPYPTTVASATQFLHGSDR